VVLDDMLNDLYFYGIRAAGVIALLAMLIKFKSLMALAQNKWFFFVLVMV
jgi:hypothetical protein